MTYQCPVCAYAGLDEPPVDFTICPSCGTEFGYHDFIRGHDELRSRWIATGPAWHSSVIPAPFQWDGIEQLRRGGLLESVEYENVGMNTQTEIAVIEIGRHSTLVNIPTGNARIDAIEYGVGHIVNLLERLRFAGLSEARA
jgi:hypothetical protein